MPLIRPLLISHSFAVVIATSAITPITYADFFLSYFEAPAEIQTGETFTVDLWLEYSGRFNTGGDMFAGLLTSVALTSPSATASIASTAYDSPVALPGAGELSGTELRNITTGQLATVGPFNFDNPIRLFSFDVFAGNEDGLISLSHSAHDAADGVLASWYFNSDSFSTFDSDDPDIDLFLESTTVRVVPAPASAVLAVAALAFAHRRRSC